PIIQADADIFVGRGQAKLTSKQEGVQLRYTTDGADPKPTSPTLPDAHGAIALSQTCTVAAQAFRGQRPVSPVAKRKFTKVDPLPPINAPGPTPTASGVQFAYYEGTW